MRIINAYGCTNIILPLRPFAAMLLRVGHGTTAAEHLSVDDLEVPQETCAQGSLVDKVFKDVTQEECGG